MAKRSTSSSVAENLGPEQKRAASNAASSQNNPLPSVSIIIALYNAAPYISECLDSILDQTYQGPIEGVGSLFVMHLFHAPRLNRFLFCCPLSPSIYS